VSLVRSSGERGSDRGTPTATTIAFALIGLVIGVTAGWVAALAAFANSEGSESKFGVFSTRMLVGGGIGIAIGAAIGRLTALERPFVSTRRLESSTAIGVLVIGFAIAIFLTSGCTRYVRFPPAGGVTINTYQCAAPDHRIGLRLAIASGAVLVAAPLLVLARRRS
jgi:hypothetical protein